MLNPQMPPTPSNATPMMNQTIAPTYAEKRNKSEKPKSSLTTL
jgi:hypothetical protein